MKIGIFELTEPIPDLKSPHVLAVLRPWIDAGNAGTLAIERVESILAARELGKITRPGMFYDFTRYRPMTRYVKTERQIVVPNSVITFSQTGKSNDLVFLHMLEPHSFGEDYVDSVLQLLTKIKASRYCLMGSMYDMVPHSRPLLITGGGTGKTTAIDTERAGITSSKYEGPTTICSLIPQEASKLGIETMSIMTHLPQYTELEDDFIGQASLLKVLNQIYDIPVEGKIMARAEQQVKDIDAAVNRNRKIKDIVTRLEAHYDAQQTSREQKEMPKLSPDVENFLKEMERKFRQD